MENTTLTVQIEDSSLSPQKLAQYARSQGLTAEITPMASTRDLVIMTGERGALEQILTKIKNKVGWTEWKSLPDTETKVKSLRAKYSSKGINNGSEDARTFARRVLLSKYPDERWNIDEFIKQSAMSPDDYIEDRDVIEQYAEYCD